MQLFNILESNLEIKGAHLLEASAGTGKTFAIEHLVLRLILDKFSLNEILLVTFTKAATRELKKRIRTNLQTAFQLLQTDKKSPWEYLNQIPDKKEAARRIFIALASFDQARIFTIHGFCHKSLYDHAFESDTALFTQEEESSHPDLLRSLVRTYLKNELQLLHPKQLELLLKQSRGDVGDLVQKIVQKIKGKELQAPLSFQNLYAQLQKKINDFPVTTQEALLNEFDQIKGCYKQMGAKEFPLQIAHLGTLIEKREISLTDLSILLQKPYFLERIQKENLKVRVQEKPAPILSCLSKEILPLIAEIASGDLLFQTITYTCQKLWYTFLKEEEQTTHDGLIKRMAETLNKESFCHAIQKSYRAAIIDEFQDTDRVQWTIFHRLFFQKIELFYLVGDPKQSIYGFRDADLYTYLEAKETLSSTRSLAINFRSGPSLISALNTIFSSTQWLHLPKVNQKLSFEPVQARPGGENYAFNDAFGAVHFINVLDEESLFAFLFTEIQRYADLSWALLVKDRFQADRLYQFLSQKGLNLLLKRSINLTETKAFKSLHKILTAAVSPYNIKKIHTALSSSLLSWTALDLIEKSHEGEALFFELHNKLDLGFSHFFQRLLQEINCCDTEILSDCEQLIELLLQQESEGKFSISLVHYLNDLKAHHFDDEKFTVRNKNSSNIQILTTHKSKGLEFDCVCALGVATGHKSQEEEDPEKEADLLRQLYVALTRAKKRVYIPQFLSQKKGALSALDRFFALQERPKEAIIEEWGKNASITCSNIENIEIPEIMGKKKIVIPNVVYLGEKSERRILSFSSIGHKTAVSTQKHAAVETRNFHGLPQGTETGTILHKLLEEAILERNGLEERVRAACAKGALKGWEKEVLELICETLELKIGEVTLSSLSPTNCLCEAEFLFSLPSGSLLKGFIDLVFEHENRVYLIDWKSNFLGPTNEFYTQEHLHKAMEEQNYFLQASIYMESIKRYLKLFPEKEFHSAHYIFLRGQTVFQFVPEPLKILA